MAKEKDPIQKPEEMKESEPKTSLQRRTILKSLVGLPVLGVLAYEVIKKWNFEGQMKNRVIEELGLENLKAPVIVKSTSAKPGNLLRIGMIGLGNRAQQLSNGLGFMHPADSEKRKKANSLAG